MYSLIVERAVARSGAWTSIATAVIS